MNLLNDTDAIAQYSEEIHKKFPIDTDVFEWRSLSPGECIYEQGYPLPFLSFLVRGKVKIYTTSKEGKQLIVTFNKPIELFGDIELVQQVDALNTVEAVTPVHLALLPLGVAHRWRADATFNEILLQAISLKFITKSVNLSFHLLHEADVRLASYLTSISHDEHGNFINPFIPKSELKMIAEFIGITVRHQNRCVQSLEKDGIIKRIPGFIEIINPKRLSKYAKQNIYEMQ